MNQTWNNSLPLYNEPDRKQ